MASARRADNAPHTPHTVTLKAVLKKSPSQLSSEEKSFLQESWDVLNDDIRAKFAEVAPEEPENGGDEPEKLDDAAVEKMLSEKTKGIIESQAEAIGVRIGKRVADAVEKARERGIDTGDQSKKEANESVRKFMIALKTGDFATARSLGMKAVDSTSDGSGADAGLTIPEPLANEIIRIGSTGYGRARELFAYHRLTQGNSRKVTALGSALSMFWTDEGGEKQSTQPTFDIVTLTLKKLAAIIPFTDEVLEDSGIDLVGLVAQLVREATDKEVDTQFFMGDGTVWTGIFRDTSIPATELATDVTAAGLRPEDIIALADNTPLGVNGRYAMHRTVLSKIRTLRQNADGTGDYLYNPLGGGAFGTINNAPVELLEAAPTYASATATGANLPIMMFGDFKRGVAYGEKSDIRFKLLDQATITDVDGTTTINLAQQDMTALRAVQRVGMKVTLPSAMRRLVTGD
jgi:HK97 family phage major capsid protein